MTRANTTRSRLDRRLRRLERQNRCCRIAVVGLLGLCAIAMLAGGGWGGNDLLEARGLLLRSPDGTLRGSFVVGDDGGVRLTFVDEFKRARAGLWMDQDGTCALWGFDFSQRLSQRSPAQAAPRPVADHTESAGKLVAVQSDTRIIERRRDRWICGYRLTLRNDTGQVIDQPFHVNLVDGQGYVLGRQPRMIRLDPGESLTLNGEIALSAERADQVVGAMLAVYGK